MPPSPFRLHFLNALLRPYGIAPAASMIAKKGGLERLALTRICLPVPLQGIISTDNGTPEGIENCVEGGCVRCKNGAQSMPVEAQVESVIPRELRDLSFSILLA